MHHVLRRNTLAIAVSALIIGCGGGGGGGDDGSTQPTSQQSPTLYPPGGNTNPKNSNQQTTRQAKGQTPRSTDTPPTTPKPAPVVAPEPVPVAPTPTVSSDMRSFSEVATTQLNQPRASRDLPDDATGQQIKIIYAVPRGGSDRRLDTSAWMRNSIMTMQNWLRGQTSNRLEMKLDTYQGRLDVQYVEMPRTEQEYLALDTELIPTLQDDLQRMGQLNPNKLYVLYYESDWHISCGTASSSLWGGRISVLFLKGLGGTVPGTPAGVNPCENNPKATSEHDVPTYWDRTFFHEFLHQIGVPHVGDSPLDIMYGYGEFGAPARPTQDNEFVLDYGADTYAFDRSQRIRGRGQVNVYDSPFFRRIVGR